MKTVYRVNIIESERGWGQKIDDIKYFSTKEKATAFIADFNKDNNLSYVPDWYMVAEGPYTMTVPDSEEIL